MGAQDQVLKTDEQDWIALLRAVLRQGATYVGLMIIGLVWLGLDFHLASERQHAERAAVQTSRNLARAFEEHLSRSLKDVDRTLQILRASYESNRAAFDFTGFLKTTHVSDHPAMQVVIIGRNGDVLMRSVGPVLPVVNVSDRPHFRHLADTGADEFIISEPVVGRGTGKLSVHLSRPLRKPDGSFDGIITASLDPQYFAEFYQSIDIGRDAFVSVVGLDGIVRAVGGSPANLIGSNLTGSQLFKRHASAQSGWYYDDAEDGDGVRRLKAYRGAKDFPLIVSVGMAAHEIFADIQFRRRAYRLIGSLFTLLILFVTGYSVWGRVRLEQTSEALQTQNMRFDAALNNMSHGLCMFDEAARLVVCNERYLKLYGLSPDLAKPGTTLHELLEQRKALGTFRADPERYIAELRAQIAEGKASTVTVELPDGRVIAVLNSPMEGGGWVALHEDITEQRHAEQEVARTKNFLDTVIENVPATIIVKDARDFRFILINQAGEEFFGRPVHEVIGKTPYDILPKAAADSIAARDYELLSVDRQDYYHEPPLNKREGGMQLVSTRRRIIRGPDGEPRYIMSVVEDQTEQKRAEARIQHMAHHDALTDLPNRMMLMVKINEALARLRLRGDSFCIFLLDLDQFKSVNDSLGHLMGDVLLKMVAQRLIAGARETDIVARLGGDEFAILQVVERNPREAAAALAQQIVEAVTAPYDLDGQQVVIGTSIGVAIAPDNGSDANELLIRADLALYRAKSEGRNGCRYFEAAMEAEVRARHALESNLRQAVARNEFELHYQTIVDIASQEPHGVEALVRWRHPQLGMVRPDQFIPLAEETGLIVPLGAWILHRPAATRPAGRRISASPSTFRRRSSAPAT